MEHIFYMLEAVLQREVVLENISRICFSGYRILEFFLPSLPEKRRRLMQLSIC